MNLRIPVLACLAFVSVPTADAAAAAARCSGFVVSGLEVTRVRATGVTCTEARKQARAWVRSDDCNPVTATSAECELRRYTCENREGPGFASTIVCRRSGRRVTFRVGPL